MVANITKDMKYPLALIGDDMEVVWLNDNAQVYFSGKKLPKTLKDCAVDLDEEEVKEKINKGQSCTFTAKGNKNKKVFVFDMAYCEDHMILAIWTEKNEDVREQYEQIRINSMVMQHTGRLAMQGLFNAVDRLERDPKIEQDEELSSALSRVEREAYKMYLLLNDLQLFYRENSDFPVESMKKFEITEYMDDLMRATRMTLISLDVNLQYKNKVDGERYATANPENFATSILKLLKAIVMLSGNDRNIRVTVSEKENELLVKIVGKNNRLLEYISKGQYDRKFSEKAADADNLVHAFSYTTAELMIRRNNMTLDSNRCKDDTVSLCVRIPSTKDSVGALKSEREAYMGNRFSTINLVFGDVL